MFSTLPKTHFNFVLPLFCHLQMLSIWTSLKFCCLVKKFWQSWSTLKNARLPYVLFIVFLVLKLIFSSTGHRPGSLCHGPLSVRPSVHPSIRLCVNFFLKHLPLWNYLSDFDEIAQKCSYHGPFQNLLKEFDSFKNPGCHGNKTYFFLNLFKSSCQNL